MWPSVRLICNRVKDEDGDKVYQGAVLTNYTLTALKECANTVLVDVKRLEDRMKTRLEWSDLDMLRAIVVFLDTKSWVNHQLENQWRERRLMIWKR